VTPQYDIDVRKAPGVGYAWRLFRFERGTMSLAACGRAPFRWMARLDARHFLGKYRSGGLSRTSDVSRDH
jgi:hypothetical protein